MFLFQVDFEVGSLWTTVWEMLGQWMHFFIMDIFFYLNDGVCGKGESAKATYLTLE